MGRDGDGVGGGSGLGGRLLAVARVGLLGLGLSLEETTGSTLAAASLEGGRWEYRGLVLVVVLPEGLTGCILPRDCCAVVALVLC